MLINPFSGVVSSAGSSGSSNPLNKIQKAVDQLSSGNRITRASDDVSSLSVAANLQNQVTGLRSALSNTSLFNSLTQTAEGGTRQINELLGRLQNLATQASSGALSDSNREALDVEFQALLDEIDRVAENTQFNDQKLLDGSVSGEDALSISAALGETANENDPSLSIESLTKNNLLGDINIRSVEGAQQALSNIQQAQNNVGKTLASIGAFSEQLDYASAYVETAIANQEAARATLSDADFAEAATLLSQSTLQQNLEIAVRAQSNRLPPSLVELVQVNTTNS